MRVPFDTLKSTIETAFINAGLPAEKAEICARIHAESSRDGVESHGLNRVPRFIDYVAKDLVDVNAEPTLLKAKGAVENYDGNLGIGITNAQFAADRAVELAREHGIGCVSLRNTTHWMRGGTYAWQTAEQGFISICWTNTESSMPLWGSAEPGVGNNPLCIAIPRKKGAIVLDMAMSLYSWGKLGVYRLAGKELPYPGGFDSEGELTTDPAAIEETRRILPTGFWKGSGLALALDLAAAAMANGNSGTDLDRDDQGSCTGCCQIFIAYDPYLFGEEEEIQAMWDERIDAVSASTPAEPGGTVTAPGERTLKTREESLAKGVVVDEQVWAQVRALAKGDSVGDDLSGV